MFEKGTPKWGLWLREMRNEKKYQIETFWGFENENKGQIDANTAE